MTIHFGIRKSILLFYQRWNVLRFSLLKFIFGFEVANLFLQRVDSTSTLLILKKNGATIGDQCDIQSGLIFHNCKNYKNLRIGSNCHIGKNCFFDLKDEIIIGDNVVISMKCTFITHIDMNRSEVRSVFPVTKAPITIGNDSYLGVGVTVLKGVVINSHCIVAACALVNKETESYSIIGGIPAQVINTFH